MEHLHISKKNRTFAVGFHSVFVFIVFSFLVRREVGNFRRFSKEKKMYKITKTEERVMLDAAENGVFRQGDIGVLNSLMSLCGVRVANTLCSRCYIDAAIHCLYILRKGGYEVED